MLIHMDITGGLFDRADLGKSRRVKRYVINSLAPNCSRTARISDIHCEASAVAVLRSLMRREKIAMLHEFWTSRSRSRICTPYRQAIWATLIVESSQGNEERDSMSLSSSTDVFIAAAISSWVR